MEGDRRAGEPSARGQRSLRSLAVPFMRRSIFSDVSIRRAAQDGPALVAVGLATLIVAAVWPSVPATTAMALVALGATRATLARSCGAVVVMLHTIVYVMLYAVFFGAACHLMATRTGMDPLRVVDLAVSVWPMTLAVWASLGRGTGTFCCEDSAK